MSLFLRFSVLRRLPLTCFSIGTMLISCGSGKTDNKVKNAVPDSNRTAKAVLVTDSISSKVDLFFAKMTAGQKASQLIMVASSTLDKMGAPYSGVRQLVASGKVANVLFLKGPSATFKTQSADLRKMLSPGGLPPILACDCEPTLFKMKWMDVDTVTKTNLLNTNEKVVRTATKIATVMRQTGANLNFAPVADVGANKAIINNRAFGSNADTIISRASAFVMATQMMKVGATLKHFPGHGRVVGDSHKQLVYISGELTELETFRKIMAQSQPAAILMGHIAVRNNTKYGTNGLPATLSPVINKTLLRNEMGYTGLIVTDALNMGAVRNIPDADFKCLESGADIALMPLNPGALHARLVTALQKNDTLSRQLEQSVKRVIRYKLSYPLQP